VVVALGGGAVTAVTVADVPPDAGSAVEVVVVSGTVEVPAVSPGFPEHAAAPRARATARIDARLPPPRTTRSHHADAVMIGGS